MWRSPVAPGRQIGEKFFIAFLDELGNFEHFETYFIFSPIWRSGDLLEPKNANLAIFEIEIANLAITTDNPTRNGPCVQKWTNLDSKWASYSQVATFGSFWSQKPPIWRFLK